MHTPPARAALVAGIRGVGVGVVVDAEVVGAEDVALCAGAVLEVEAEAEVEGVVWEPAGEPPQAVSIAQTTTVEPNQETAEPAMGRLSR